MGAMTSMFGGASGGAGAAGAGAAGAGAGAAAGAGAGSTMLSALGAGLQAGGSGNLAGTNLSADGGQDTSVANSPAGQALARSRNQRDQLFLQSLQNLQGR